MVDYFFLSCLRAGKSTSGPDVWLILFQESGLPVLLWTAPISDTTWFWKSSKNSYPIERQRLLLQLQIGGFQFFLSGNNGHPFSHAKGVHVFLRDPHHIFTGQRQQIVFEPAPQFI